ncbi:hypothetical protein QNI19_26770 [Cytophagaceae bacterium DM2B3-1]|uniref:Transcriptional regulator n=1 Tax=Xanthocytophaga flava TaxID=3048013 RepID=A0ABT7CUE1_9BACT|nr:hypothetical protein [Xanthocytophaga flavus]MDJ1496565.1 hypothetical protein [Xanthocytophaga flavus]
MKERKVSKRIFDTLADDPELVTALEFCNFYKSDFRGVLAASTNKMNKPPTSSQISMVMTGKARHTQRNLNILLAIYEAMVLEFDAREKVLDKLRNARKIVRPNQ